MSRLFLFRLPLLILTVVVVAHTSLASRTIYGVHLDLLLLLVCSSALIGGREVGAVVGFVVGLIADAFLVTPFGLSAFVFSVLGYLLGEFERFGGRRSIFVNALLVGLGSAVGQLFFTLGLYLLGVPDPLRPQFLIEVAVVSGVNLVLAPIVLILSKFALATGEPSKPVSFRR